MKLALLVTVTAALAVTAGPALADGGAHAALKGYT
jgi:hypothetical protein